MKSLLVVFAYAGMDEMIERHWPTWEKSGCDILLCFPVDAPCKRGGLAFDTSCHYGAPLMRRTFAAFKHVLQLGYDTYYFIEADSVCIGEAPQRLLYGVQCFAWNNSDPQFKAKRYLHWPWGMNRKTLTQLEAVCKYYPPSAEQGFPDRLLGLICEENEIPTMHRPDLAYSRNRLDTPEYVAQAREAIKNGAKFIHGVKTQQDLDNLGL